MQVSSHQNPQKRKHFIGDLFPTNRSSSIDLKLGRNEQKSVFVVWTSPTEWEVDKIQRLREEEI